VDGKSTLLVFDAGGLSSTEGFVKISSPRGIEMKSLPPPSQIKHTLEAIQGAVANFLPAGTSLTLWAQTLGRAGNYFSRFLTGERSIGVADLLRLLDRAGISARLFFEEVVERLPEEPLLTILRQHSLPGRLKLNADSGSRPQLFDLIEELSTRPVMREDIELELPAELAEIDEVRFTSSTIARISLDCFLEERVRCLLENEVVSSRALAAVVDGLCLRAATSRMCDQTSEAFADYEWAALLDQRCPESVVTARLNHRVAVLFISIERVSLGLRFLDRALRSYVAAGDSIGAAKIFVDRGLAFYRMNLPKDSIRAFEIALQRIPPSLWRYRYACHQGMARNQLALGETQQSIQSLRNAVEAFGDHEEVSKGYLLWMLGSTLASFDVSAAAQFLRQAQHLLETYGSNLEAAQIALELAEILLKANKKSELAAVGSDLMRKLARFGDHPALKRALDDFVLKACYRQESLSVEELRSIKAAAMEAGRRTGFH
jgi:transcriptional regulator with XRE-family HTH domain